MSSVFVINKRIQEPMEFKGLQGPWIWGLLICVGSAILLFAVLHLTGWNAYLILICCGGYLSVSTAILLRLNKKFGPVRLQKWISWWMLPKEIKCYSRKIFKELQNGDNDQHPPDRAERL